MESSKEDMKNGSSHLEEGEKDDGMEEIVAAFQYYVEGVGILAVGSVGVVINIVALYILFRKQVSFYLENFSLVFLYHLEVNLCRRVLFFKDILS